MAYYITEHPGGSGLGPRRPTINEYFLSTYTTTVYQGCEPGCPYCDGWAISPRPLNETIRIPLDLPTRIAAELEQVPEGELVALTALSDPYQAAESTYRITRQVLQHFADQGRACLVLTKSDSVLEDLPILRRINEGSLGIVMFTLVTVEPYLAAMLEGKSPTPALRLQAITRLKEAGIPVGVALIPLLPYVNDTDYVLSNTISAIARAGADFMVWDYLHIPNERHRARTTELLARLGSYPNAYYRDLYRGAPRPTPAYCAERDKELLQRCDSLNLPVRAPLALYAGKLNPAITASLLLKHSAFRDQVLGRANLASQHRVLAERLFAGTARPDELQHSPLWPELKSILPESY